MDLLRCAGLIAAKDLRAEARSRDVLASGGLFALTVLVTVSFVLPSSGAARRDAAVGVLWVSLLFAVLLAVGRTTALEGEESCLEGLLLSPAPREAIFLGKLVANLCLVVAVEVPLVAFFLLLLSIQPAGGASLLVLVAVMLLATAGLVTVSTLFGMVAAGSRLGTSMLPLLVMPVVLPLVIAAVEASRRGLVGDLGLLGQAGQWLGLLVAFDLLVLVAGVATFPYLVEE